jgi:hypothetical protein
MKRHGPLGSGPGAGNRLRVDGHHLHIRSDAGRATPSTSASESPLSPTTPALPPASTLSAATSAWSPSPPPWSPSSSALTPALKSSSASNAPTPPTAAPLRIVIEPTATRRKCIARLGDRELCRSAWPFVMSARLLVQEGYSSDTLVEVWRPNTDAWAMRGRLGAVAATVIDGETASRRAKNGVPVRFPRIAATSVPVDIAHDVLADEAGQ